MPLVIWWLLALVVLATLGALAWSVRVLVGRLGRLGADLDQLQQALTPALRQLEVDAEVTATELGAIGDRLEQRVQAAAARPRRRWRPGPVDASQR